MIYTVAISYDIKTGGITDGVSTPSVIPKIGIKIVCLLEEIPHSVFEAVSDAPIPLHVFILPCQVSLVKGTCKKNSSCRVSSKSFW